MKLRRLAFRGITRFQGDPVRLDFEAMGPGLIALVGANGQGKTTALEAVPACLYKSFPTRPGSLYDHCHGRDAFVEAEFYGADAAQLKVRVQVDADRKTTEGYIFVNGAPITTGRAKEFEAEVERLFGSEALFLASAFSAQSKAGSFLQMDKRSRKDLFVQLLGLSYLQALSERAHDRKLGAEVDLNVARKLLESAREGATALEEAKVALAGASGARLALGLETARDVERLTAAELQEARGATERRAALVDALGRARKEHEHADLAVREAEGLAGKAEEAAQRRRQSIAVQNPDAREVQARARATEAGLRLVDRLAEAEATLREEAAVIDARDRIEALREEERGIRLKSDTIAKAVGERDAAQARMDGAIRLLEAEDKRVVLETGRLGRQAQAMKEAPCTKAPAWKPAGVAVPEDLAGTCPLLKDAREATRAILEVKVDPVIRDAAAVARHAYEKHLQRVRDMQEDFANRHALRSSQIAGELAAFEKLAARAGEMEAARVTLREATVEQATIGKQLQADLDAINDLRETIFEETAKIAADLTTALTDAGLKLVAAQDREVEAGYRKDEAEKALKGLPPLPFISEVQSRADMAVAARAKAERDISDADMKIGRLESDVDKAKAFVVAAAQREAEAKAAEERTGDWGLLERALGRDGAQALAIDAAGPEVASITNELLSAYPGRQFSIALETLREKKSAKGEFAEAFDIKVYDGPVERQVEALSGGERVVVGEALGLALSIFNSRKSGVKWATLFRDETAGALDPENAAAYVEMLRKALQLGGFDQVLFVSHSPEVWQRADVRLVVEGGRIVADAA